MSSSTKEDKKPVEVKKPETEKDPQKCCDCGCLAPLKPK